MDRIPIQDRTKIVEFYCATNSVVLAKRTFRREFPGKQCPCERTIKRLVDKLRNTDSLADNNKVHSGRPFSTRTPANIQAVRDRLQQSPQKSTRRLSQEVGISRTSVRRVIHKGLTFFPYKMQILQQQTDANKRERLEFCPSISERMENNPGVLDLIFFSDETHFHFIGHVNKQDMRYWEPNQPYEHILPPLSKKKVTVWCAIGKGGIVGPFFFEDNDGNPGTVNSKRYIEILQRKFISTI